MKKLIILILMLFQLANAQTTLKGGISASDVPVGFFGTWHVTAKLIQGDVKEFNMLSVDIWTLSSVGDALVLENPVSGASSAINITQAQDDTLKFERTTFKEGVKTTETPTLRLNGNKFFGEDTFIFEFYEGTKLIKKNVVKYKLVGQKL